MFDLEQSISSWRQQMLAAGIQSPATLEELELHLREETVRQEQLGLDAGQAFEASVRLIGRAGLLKKEFDKSNHSKLVKRIMLISAGITGVLVGPAFVMPAVAQYQHEGAMTINETCLLLLGLGFTLGGGSVAVLSFKKRKI